LSIAIVWTEKPPKAVAFGGLLFETCGSALAELRRAAGGLEAVLEQNQTLYPLILLGFQALGHSVSPSVN
jgi:hypothetical protein